MKEAVDKLLLRHNDVFAELFNFALFDGNPVVDPNELRDVPTNLAVKNEAAETVSKLNRDVAKQLVVKDGKTCRFVVLTVENQSALDPSMPMRCLEYDVATMRESYNKDHIIRPVITIVFNVSGKPWTANHSIKDMHKQGSLGSRIDYFGAIDYKIRVVSPCDWDTSYIEKMQTDLYPFVMLLNANSNQERMEAFAQDNRFKHWKPTRDLKAAIREHSNGLFFSTDKEDMNMCEVLNNLIKEKDAAVAAIKAEKDEAKAV